MRTPARITTLSAFVASIFLCGALLPFVWVATNALKGDREFYTPREERTFLPRAPTLHNFRRVLTGDSDLHYYFRNSLVVTSATIAGMLACSVLGAFAIARFRFPGREAVFLLFIGVMMVPGEAVLVSRYEMLTQLGLLDTKTGLVLPMTAGALAVSIFILRGVFEAIPRDLEDAGRIDGCGTLGVLKHVILPNAWSGIASVCVLTFLGAWNDFGLPLVVTRTRNAQTITVGISLLKNQFGMFEMHLLCAVVVLAFLPTVLLFVVMQRTFVRGIMSGAIKG